MAEERKREERSSEERQERRRRRDDTFESQGSNKMFIPDEIKARLEAEGLQPRWVNDEPGRIQRLTTKDDYDKVEGVEPVQVGAKPDGSPLFAHLLAKPVDFIQDDQRKADTKRKLVEGAMVRGAVPTKPGEDPAPVQGQLGAEVYVPDGNTIGRENRVLE